VTANAPEATLMNKQESVTIPSMGWLCAIAIVAHRRRPPTIAARSDRAEPTSTVASDDVRCVARDSDMDRGYSESRKSMVSFVHRFASAVPDDPATLAA
jgi:hypothetical protein